MSGPPSGLNEGFREDGVWWLPANPDETVAGTLTIDPIEGALLSLIGTLGRIEDSFNGATSERVTIHGLTRTGRPVTLLNSFRKTRNLSFPGLAVETHFANIAAVGYHFDHLDQDLFPEGWIRFDGIERWLGHAPFNVAVDLETLATTLSVRKAQTTELAIVESFSVQAGAGSFPATDSDTNYTVTVYSYIGVKSATPRSLEWHFSHLLKLQELASLCSGRHLHLLSLELRIPQDDALGTRQPAIEVAIYVRPKFPRPSTTPGQSTPLITAPELLAAAPDAFALWYASFEIMAPAMNLLFTVIGADQMFVNVRFLLAVQALEVFHRRTTIMRVLPTDVFDTLRQDLIRAIPAGTLPAMREKLQSLYQYANEPSLMQRLRDLLGQLASDAGDVPAGFHGDFARRIVATRNYNTHFEDSLRDKCFDSVGMHWATRRIVLMLTALFLKRLGIDPGAWPDLLGRHREFAQLWRDSGAPA